MTKYNLGFKALSLFMLMQVRIGMSPRHFFKIVNRPAGRLWVYDLGLIYFGTYAYLLSHIMGVKMAYDKKIDELCLKMASSGKKVNPEKIMDFTTLADWKCYLYKWDLWTAKMF